MIYEPFVTCLQGMTIVSRRPARFGDAYLGMGVLRVGERRGRRGRRCR